MKKTLTVMFIALICSVFAHAQNITGRVTNEEGLPLPGATVLEKGTNNGTITDVEGHYSIDVSKEAILAFNFVGYLTEEISVNEQTTIDVSLIPDITRLDEIIVVGYGTQKKSDITGAVSSISAEDIAELPVSTAQQALQGRIAGVDVVSIGTTPGSDVNIRIRGRRSFAAGNDPLFIVDGIPFSGSVNDINPQDIQSMEVLKDASATAIYGSRGANGVILVTTKRGSVGKLSVSYSGYYGVSSASTTENIMNATEFAEWRREGNRRVGTYDDSDPTASDAAIFTTAELDALQNGTNTDWVDLMLQNGSQQSHQIGINGGTEQTNYAFSMNYYDEKGIVEGMDYNRVSLQSSIDQEIGNRIKVGASIRATQSTRDGNGWNPLFTAVRMSPLKVPYDDEGFLIFYADENEKVISNPLCDLVPGAVVIEDKSFRFFTSLYGKVEITKDLTFTMNYGGDFSSGRDGDYYGPLTYNRLEQAAIGNVVNRSTFAYTWENMLTYSKTFNGVHSLNIDGLYSQQKQTSESFGLQTSGVPIEYMTFLDQDASLSVAAYNSSGTVWGIESYMGRINYRFDNRYLVTATARADGSSRMAEGNKWGIFPSFSLAWRISEESFIKGNPVISNLKLRASYGKIGNTGVNAYATKGSLLRRNYTWGTTGGIYGYAPNNAPNNQLSWENTATTNIGLDFGFLKNRISGSLELYKAYTTDLLLQRFYPPSSGTSNSNLQNIGKTQNMGIEVTLSTVNVASNNFQWTTDWSFFSNREEIIDLYGDKTDDVGNGWFIGEPITAYYDWKKIGVWQLDEADEAASYGSQPGNIKIEDNSGRDAAGNKIPGADGAITAEDRVVFGSDMADWSGGITNRFEFKGLDFSFFIYIRQGGMIQNNALMDGQGRQNNLKIDYWTATNPSNTFRQPNKGQTMAYDASFRYFDASFIKVRNIQLGYNLPSALVNKLSMSSIRVYASAQNPFTFSKYQKDFGIDPELAVRPTNGAENTPAYTAGNTPPTRLIIFGINAKF